MKRLHVSVAVKDLTQSVRFYSTLFGAEPTVIKSDYAKWMLEDPRVNFSISARDKQAGLDHLGIQVESQDELAEVAGRLDAAEQSILKQDQTTCCYARSDKAWVADPQGIAWETFFTFGESSVYGEDAEAIARVAPESKPSAQCCCARP